MSTAEQSALAFRDVRRVSGFNRPMSVAAAFMYNFLTMGVIFPWTYLWGPAAFPGGSVEWAILIATLVQIPISLAYCALATVLPVTGGDYVYQKFAFRRWGFVSVMSGFVIWILQWVALSGWLLVTLGLAPLLLASGVHFKMPALIAAAIALQTPLGIAITSALLALLTTVFLLRGMRAYVRIQYWLFAATLVAVVLTLCVFFMYRGGGIDIALTDFTNQLASHTSVPETLRQSFTGGIVDTVRSGGFNPTPPFSLLATLGIVPIAWTSLQWATYSVEQSTEIADADRFSKQVIMLACSALAVGACLWIVAVAERVALGREFTTAASAAYWLGTGSAELTGFLKGVVQPFPNVIAIAASRYWLIALGIALGFIANAFQVTCNCFIGVTRILVAMSSDGLLPRSWALDRVDPKRHSPTRAHWFYFGFSLLAIAAYNFVPSWTTYTLGVTFACGYVFALSALSAAFIPTRMADLWKNSEIRHVSAWRLKLLGYSAFILAAVMVASYLLLPQLGLVGDEPYLIVVGVIVVSYVVYLFAKSRSSLVDKAFTREPDEITALYGE